MNDAAHPKRLFVTADMAPALPRHVRMKFDKVREMWLLLAPERVLTPDPIAVEVLQHCDGDRDVRGIAALLAEKYTAPVAEIETDVIAMLQELADKGFLAVSRKEE